MLGCAVNGIGEASHADFGITGAKNEGLIFSRGRALRKVPQEQLVDTLFAEIDKYVKGGKQVDVDAREAAEGAAWLQAIEDENAGDMTPSASPRWRRPPPTRSTRTRWRRCRADCSTSSPRRRASTRTPRPRPAAASRRS